MSGAIIYSGRYGSTAQYSQWISEETGLPVFSIDDKQADPSQFDFLILGSSVIIYKLTIRKWIKTNTRCLENKPVLLFTVSGAPAGPKLDSWVAASIPDCLLGKFKHVALGGRQIPEELRWLDRLMLIIGAWKSSDSKVKNEELNGFDFMDRSSIKPIINWASNLLCVDVHS